MNQMLCSAFYCHTEIKMRKYFIAMNLLLLAIFLPVQVVAFSLDPKKVSPKNAITSRLSELGSNVFQNPFAPPPAPVALEEEVSVLDMLSIESSMEPRTFSVEPSQLLNVASASLPFLFRAGSGAFADGYRLSIINKDETKYTIASIGNYQIQETCSPTVASLSKRPMRGPIIIYEFETCPLCRKVREAVSTLSLEVDYRPCPKDGNIYRNEIKNKYGSQATFPLMIDPNTGIEMFESDDIIKYLFRAYGDGIVPSSLTGGGVTVLTAGLGLLGRLGKGGKSKNSKPPEQSLILWAYESSPFCKLVKEELGELQIAHRQISCPRGSPNRQRLFEKTGRFQVPYLEDPNNGVALFETSAIIEYLQKMYGIKPTPVQYM